MFFRHLTTHFVVLIPGVEGLSWLNHGWYRLKGIDEPGGVIGTGSPVRTSQISTPCPNW